MKADVDAQLERFAMLLVCTVHRRKIECIVLLAKEVAHGTLQLKRIEAENDTCTEE